MGISKYRRIIANSVSDDGWISRPDTTLTDPEVVKKEMVDIYDGSPVDAVTWCVGDREVYGYETNVGERFGDGYDNFEEERDYWTYQNYSMDSPRAPLAEVIRQFRMAGIDFFPSVRMNSHYATPYFSPRYGRFRRENPELLIGQPGEYIPSPTIEYAISHGIDYKFPDVRDHMTSIIFELFERFEVDGIELDYMRHPAFFRKEEGYSNRYIMSDFVQRVRHRMDEVGKERGRKLELLVRVPPTLYDSSRIGLDVEAWIKDGLVDIVVAGGGFLPFEMPIREFVKVASGTGCQVYGGLEALRWALDPEVLHALAARFWDAGVDGIYLFNYVRTPNEWKRRVLSDMVSEERLPFLNKRYELDHSDRVAGKSGHHGAFANVLPSASLPVFMDETLDDGGPVLSIDISDDISAAQMDGTLGACTLELGFDHFGDDDELRVSINGESVSWDTRQVSNEGWEHLEFGVSNGQTTLVPGSVPGVLIRFDVPPLPFRKGINDLTVRIIKGSSSRLKPVVLKEVRVSVTYKQDAL